MSKIITMKFECDEDVTQEQLHELLCVTIHEQGGPNEELEIIKMKVIDIAMEDQI